VLVNKIKTVTLENLSSDNLAEQGAPDDFIDDSMLDEFLPDLPFDDHEFEELAEQGSDQKPPENKPVDDTTFHTDPSPVSSNKDDKNINAYSDTVHGNKTAEQASTFYGSASNAPDVQVQEAPPKAFHVFTPTLPKAEPLPRSDQNPRCIYITLDTCGDKNQDVRRLRRLHDILVSRPGRDQFAFRVRERGFWYEIDFPNVTTGLTDTLIKKLEKLMGANNIEITQLI
jgi:hypothetical protein